MVNSSVRGLLLSSAVFAAVVACRIMLRLRWRVWPCFLAVQQALECQDLAEDAAGSAP
jgi:hypothetical protein